MFAMNDYKLIKKENYNYLIDNEKFIFLRTNDTGIEILEKLNGDKEVIEVIEEMSHKYGIPTRLLESDILNFIDGIDKNIVTNKKDFRDILKRVYVDLINEREEMPFEKLEEYLDNVKKLSQKEAIFYLKEYSISHSKIELILEKVKRCSSHVILYLDSYEDVKDKIGLISKYIDIVFINTSDIRSENLFQLNNNQKYTNFIDKIELFKMHDINVFFNIYPNENNIDNMINIQNIAYELGVSGINIESIFNYENINTNVINEFDDKKEEMIKKNIYLNSWKNNSLKKNKSNYLILSFSEDRCINSMGNIAIRNNCGMGVNEIKIDINGQISMCHISNCCVKKVSDFEAYNKVRKTIIENTDKSDHCKDCLYWMFCLSGCKVRNIVEANDEYYSKKFCKMKLKKLDDFFESRALK